MNSENPDLLPITEQENLKTTNLSSSPVREIIRLMNDEDALVASAISLVLPDVERAIEGIVARIRSGGRLFYTGTGTSGRLGVLDAAECPPTFGVSPDLVQAVIAGGYEACYRAVEASEDDAAAGEADLRARAFARGDALQSIKVGYGTHRLPKVDVFDDSVLHQFSFCACAVNSYHLSTLEMVQLHRHFFLFCKTH